MENKRRKKKKRRKNDSNSGSGVCNISSEQVCKVNIASTAPNWDSPPDRECPVATSTVPSVREAVVDKKSSIATNFSSESISKDSLKAQNTNDLLQDMLQYYTTCLDDEGFLLFDTIFGRLCHRIFIKYFVSLFLFFIWSGRVCILFFVHFE